MGNATIDQTELSLLTPDLILSGRKQDEQNELQRKK